MDSPVHQRNAFDFLHGTWDVSHAVRQGRLDGSTDWDTLRGRAVCAPVLDGAGNLDQIWLPHRSAIGATLRLYDAENDVWRLHWSSSDRARLDPPLEGRFQAGIGTFEGRDTLRGQAIDLRFVWDDIAPDQARWTQYFAVHGSEDWEPNWIMRFRRVSAGGVSASTAMIDLDPGRDLDPG